MILSDSPQGVLTIAPIRGNDYLIYFPIAINIRTICCLL